MAIIIDEKKKVIVQGITGREGQLRTKLMKEYGTNVLGGVSPGKGGMEVLGLPVFDTVYEAMEKLGEIDISVVFVPAPFVKDAAMESIDAGVKFLVLIPDRVPVQDVLEIVEFAKEKNATFLGPNTLGVISINKGILGMIGGNAKRAREWFKKGPVGISSRSGGITSAISYYICREGIGISTAVHIGGDPIIGLTQPEIMERFEKDPETRIVVMFGEIGTTQEEKVAEMMQKGKFTKPLVAYISGKGAKSGMRFSHAGAIIEGGKGTYESKVNALKDVGAILVDNFMDIPKKVKEIINGLKTGN